MKTYKPLDQYKYTVYGNRMARSISGGIVTFGMMSGHSDSIMWMMTSSTNQQEKLSTRLT